MLFGFAGATVLSPVANFTANVTSGTAPLPVSFTDQSTGGSPAGWAWYFGDEKYNALWTKVNAAAGWTARSGQSSVVLPDGSIVLMGGTEADGNTGDKNDVWRSTDNGSTWTQQTAGAGWTGRFGQSSVAMADGSIVLMGGYGGPGILFNDVWRSTDKGKTWNMVNTSVPGWTARTWHSSVALPDGSIVLMGGTDGYGVRNDTWRSTNKGATWTRMNASSGWRGRVAQSSVVLPDGSIVLMGGGGTGGFKNDVWRSTDKGKTWALMTAQANWTARDMQSSVVMPDGSIVVTGGWDGTNKNDVWRSTDKGTTWTKVTAGAGWTARHYHSSVVMPDGSIVLMGGNDTSVKNDVWRFKTAGSSVRNPLHIYTKPGSYTVALQAYNAGGYNSTRKSGYITVTPAYTITVVVPNGGDNWKRGSSHTITWSYTGSPGSKVKIELLKGTAVNKVINASTAVGSSGSGSYNWRVPYNQILGTDYKIRITSTTNAAYTDKSNANFTISAGAPITVVVPNGGQNWIRGSTHAITWSYTGSPGPKVKIDLLKGSAVNRVINASTSIGSAGSGSYSWKIPSGQTTGIDYKIRINSTSNAAYTDKSNANFTISAF